MELALWSAAWMHLIPALDLRLISGVRRRNPLTDWCPRNPANMMMLLDPRTDPDASIEMSYSSQTPVCQYASGTLAHVEDCTSSRHVISACSGCVHMRLTRPCYRERSTVRVPSQSVRHSLDKVLSCACLASSTSKNEGLSGLSFPGRS
jgi:hypothetical protein